MDEKLQYKVVITGAHAPFKWAVKEVAPQGMAREKSGQADTYADALMDAGAAAKVFEAEREHRLVKRTEVVLEVDRELNPGEPALLDFDERL